MKKKFLIIALFAVIFMIPVTYAQTSSTNVFTDIGSNSPYYTALLNLKSAGIVSGYPDGSFRPANTINRAEFTKIVTLAVYGSLVNSTCMDHYVDKSGNYINIFTDVMSANKADMPWYVQFVCYAKYNNIITGYPDGSFKPLNEINFAESAKILTKTYNIPVKTMYGVAWYIPYVNALNALGVVPPTVKSPEQKINRGEMALLVFGIKNLNGNYAAAP